MNSGPTNFAEVLNTSIDTTISSSQRVRIRPAGFRVEFGNGRAIDCIPDLSPTPPNGPVLGGPRLPNQPEIDIDEEVIQLFSKTSDLVAGLVDRLLGSDGGGDKTTITLPDGTKIVCH